MKDRGLVKPGFRADLVLIDPETVSKVKGKRHLQEKRDSANEEASGCFSNAKVLESTLLILLPILVV